MLIGHGSSIDLAAVLSLFSGEVKGQNARAVKLFHHPLDLYSSALQEMTLLKKPMTVLSPANAPSSTLLNNVPGLVLHNLLLSNIKYFCLLWNYFCPFNLCGVDPSQFKTHKAV